MHIVVLLDIHAYGYTHMAIYQQMQKAKEMKKEKLPWEDEGVSPIKEGMVRKGGINPPSTIKRPAPPAPMRKIRKAYISIRLDQDILDFFERDGPGYQTRINAALRDYIMRVTGKDLTGD
jgi:uncharacterized protein (DUF4415 family)